jgi:FkbM family methyltransferase
MGMILKRTGDYLLGVFNFNIRRRLNGRKVIVPVRSGIKVTISGEKWMSEILKKLFSHYEGAFLDIGANLGQTLIKVKTVDPDRKYIGFEPNPSCVFYLQHLVSKNNWSNVTLVSTGVYHSNCLLNLVSEHETHGSSTVIDDFKIDSRFSSMKAKLVPLLAFSTIQESISSDNISFIKIDVEGAELEVMESLFDTIKLNRPIILLEIWQNKGDPLKIPRAGKIVDMVVLLNYKVFSWVDVKNEPYYTKFQETKLGASKSENYVLLPHERQEKIIGILKG